jgi:predicted NUDIX family NTP pyrophosphohydrolase
MPSPREISAGILAFRREKELEVLLAHPGGPFWSKKDAGAWTIPKGLVEAADDIAAAARREFTEETSLSQKAPRLSFRRSGKKAAS